jgi:O-succinylbenzoate synthase
MRLLDVELITVQMPLVSPFTTSFGVQTERFPLLVRVDVELDGSVATGWGECVALLDPVYSPEYLHSARHVLERYLVPMLRALPEPWGPGDIGAALEPIVGHPMAKAALEMALLDASLRASSTSLAGYLGVTATSVPSGVSVGIQDSVPALLEVVGDYLDQGYVRIKLKIKPGWDYEPVRAVRERFGDIPLQVDANTAYRLEDAATLRRLDEFGLLLIEQPLAEGDLRQHSLLAREISTPVCLDESITSAATATDAIALGAAAVINVKPGRVGGYLEARRIHDLARAAGVPVWCGGMVETGIGRHANAALAGLPGFTLPGDISASDRFYREDITAPVVMTGGRIPIWSGPGVSPQPIAAAVEEFSVGRVSLPGR